jgi:transposase-like protein
MTDGLTVCCKSCGCSDVIKNGIVRGHQRYRCRECRYNFTQTARRGVPVALKSLALVLYGLCGVSMNKIGKMLGVSNVAVLKWVRKEAQGIKEPSPKADSGVVMIDEMWHYVSGKKTKYGCGAPLMAYRVDLWAGHWVAVVMPRLNA